LVGVYRTRLGGTVIIVDAAAPDCHAPSHRINAVLSMIGVAGGADEGAVSSNEHRDDPPPPPEPRDDDRADRRLRDG
jgi:hypothetical protein